MKMRRFNLMRTEDVSGVSGTGVVAEGCEFSNGRCALTWLRSTFPAVTIFDSIKAVESVHGHEGATHVVWIDLP
jgi:hypothetical protein